jgi:glycosyltransferase involved in cell wall biosynthesis
MKVCFLVSTYEPDTTGGQGEVVFRLQKSLQELSVDAYVFTSGSRVPGYLHTMRTGSGKRFFYAVSAVYVNWFRKMDFDVINVHQESGLSVIPLLVASRCRAKIVTTLHTSYLSESRSLSRLTGFRPEQAAPTLDEYFVKYLLTPIKVFGTSLDCALSDKIVAVCAKTREECKLDYGIPEEKMTVIYNGVNLIEFNPQITRSKIRSEYSLDDKPVILSVGCGTIRKGIPYLLRSVRDVKAQIPDVRLIVTGPTSYKQQMLSITRDLGIQENVIFSGKVPREELPFYYSACDIVAVPSLQEGFPIVVLEAMASGKPVVASRVGGIPEAIEPGKTGILVDAGNSNQLGRALITLLNDQDLRRRMGREARLVAETRFDWERIAQRYIDEFDSLL